MPQISLFDFETQLQELNLVPVVMLDPTPAQVDEVLSSLGEVTVEAEETEERPVEVAETAAPAATTPAYREMEWIRAQAEGKAGSVALARIGRKYIAVLPLDLDAALMLNAYRNSEANVLTEQKRMKNGETRTVVLSDGSDAEYTPVSAASTGLIRACVDTDSKKEKDRRVYFPFANLFNADTKDTFLVQHLQGAGFNVIIPPSVERWIGKEARRIQRELVAYDLPEIKDRRPLFDQMEEGLMLVCKQDSGEFKKDKKYVLTNLTDANGSDNGVQLQEIIGEGEAARLSTDQLTWYNNGPMETVFSLEAGTETVYDPEKSLVALYPAEHARNVKRLEAMNFDLYRHTIYDAAQGAMKRDVVNCKPQRMGKTSEAIATALLWGSQRIGFVSPSKDTRMEVRKELDRLGLNKYAFVDSFDDLEKALAAGTRWYLMDYWFLKGLENDSAPKGNDKFNNDVDAPGPGEMFARCPYCNEMLERLEFDALSSDHGRWRRTMKFGYRCFNKQCTHQQEAPKVRRISPGRYTGRKNGAAWWDPTQRTVTVGSSAPQASTEEGSEAPTPAVVPSGSGYVDYERAKLATFYEDLRRRSRSVNLRDDHPKLAFKGRMHPQTQFVKKAWSPARYKRIKKLFGTLIVDEAHSMASGFRSDQSRCILGMQPKHHITLTGTPMPNAPSDPYWMCHWTFGGGTKLFPYFRGGENGFTKYWRTFCKNVEITNAQGQRRRKKLPIATAPLKQRKLHAPLIIRRTFSDPLVVQSLLEKGFHYPTVHYSTVKCAPDPYQADLLVNAMDRFQQAYDEHIAEMEAEEREVNTAYVLSSMSLLKVAATCPDFLNLKLANAGIEGKLYNGVPGGGKTKEIKRIIHRKLHAGEKVLLVSFYKHELNVLMKELADYDPVLYDIDNWDADERFECRQRFLNDPKCKLLLGSIQALQVGVDLSSANTVICADLLWSPGKQDQAVARILKPLKDQRDCDIYYCVLEHSLDEHVFSTFYSKKVAAEQVMDGVITTPRPTDFNIKAFVDQVLSERAAMQKYAINVQMESTNYIPLLNSLATLRDRE